jgi:hypothetical protein
MTPIFYNNNMIKNTIFLLILYLLANSIYSQGVYNCPSGNELSIIAEPVSAYIGIFIPGSNYEITFGCNEIIYTIKAEKYITKKYKVTFDNSESQNGNNKNIKLRTEWFAYTSEDKYVNGKVYEFYGSMIIKVKCKEVYINSRSIAGHSQFRQTLSFEVVTN